MSSKLPTDEVTLIVPNSNFSTELLEQLNEWRQEGLFTDVCLVTLQDEFPCHKNVLAVNSPYFRALFTKPWKESHQEKVHLKDVSVWTLKRLIDFMYTGNLQLSVDTAQDMLSAGNLFQLHHVVEATKKFIAERLDFTNCLGIEQFANLHCCDDLEQDAHKCALENFQVVTDGVEFLCLSVDRVEEYLRLDDIDVTSEEQVFEIAMRWLNYDPPNRAHFACRLLTCVRFGLINTNFLTNNVLIESHISNCDNCRSIVKGFTNQQMQCSGMTNIENNGPKEPLQRPRKWTVPRETLVALGGFSDSHSASNCVRAYDVTRGRWHDLAPMPSTLSWFNAVEFRNDIYVTGGLLASEGVIVSTVWKFCTKTRCWEQASPLVTSRARHASAATEDAIYVMGGIEQDEDGKLKAIETIEGYNPSTDSWSVVGKYEFPRKQSSLVAQNAMLIEVGGTRHEGLVEPTMDMYAIRDGRVEHTGEHFRLTSDLQFAQLLHLDGIFYILWEKEQDFLRINPVRRTSRVLAKPTFEHAHSGAAIVGGKIYVAGGLHESLPISSVECYDPDTDVWTTVTAMPDKRACLFCVKVVI